ncbi:hypothetical protein POF50_031095 [Streptomyces sp. SL13]|jgi:hypothetical protein|uniref:LapA family protein n=1 Tax=Streptantibioticus silvisoli TaxID=2705255 RepID=A0AA90H9M8_9ACTN|nr:hypothetical protein [Streptantibioticus silvisoli]MDI5967084.1 hypothetical protein [Streptantibioticus silvisoli]MDI5973735.1 hypothetical protein [Streptantibioticus silvisoli]
MLIIGLLLIAATAVFSALLIAFNLSGGPNYAVSMFGSHPFTISVLGAFLGGLALALIFGLGLWLMLGGAALLARRRRKHLAARHEARDAVAERDDMRGQLDDARGTSATDPSREGATRRPGPTRHRGSHRLHLPGH